MPNLINNDVDLSLATNVAVNNVIKEKPNITRKEMSLQLNVSVSKIYRAINELKQKGYIKRLEGRKLGHWEIIKYP